MCDWRLALAKLGKAVALDDFPARVTKVVGGVNDVNTFNVSPRKVSNQPIGQGLDISSRASQGVT